MTMTRAQMRTRVQRHMDAVSSTRWDTTAGATGEQDQAMGVVFDRWWKRILNAQRAYRMAQRTPTSHATTGKYALSDLDSGSGDTAQRLYRVMAVVIDTMPYTEVAPEDYVLQASANSGSMSLVWWREGTNIATLPVQLSKVATGIWVNYLPTRIDNLSADSISVDFPDGYEDVVAWGAAAILFDKGGAESAASERAFQWENTLGDEMLQDLGRLSTKPMTFRYSDSASDWGG